MAGVPSSSLFCSLCRRPPPKPACCLASSPAASSRRIPSRSRASSRGRTRSSARSEWSFTIFPGGSFGLDKPVVAVLAPVDHGPFLRPFAPEEERFLALDVDLDERLFDGHGLEGEVLASYHPFLGLRGLEDRNEDLPLPPAAPPLVPPLDPFLPDLLLQVVEGPVQRIHHVQRLFDDDEAAALRPDVDLGLVPVLLDVQDDVDVDDVADEAL